MAFHWLNEDSRKFLSRGYINGNMTAEERVREIAKTAENILDKEGFADKFYDYMSRGFYSLSSPVWSNFGTKKGLPISCNGVFIEDSVESMAHQLILALFVLVAPRSSQAAKQMVQFIMRTCLKQL
jgi:ribonucleoside-diphosphate reductase alpha chain